MKTRIFLPLFLLAILFSSCSKFGYVTLSYPVEPQVYLPEDIGEIVMVNRSLTDEEAKDDKIVEAIFSSEIAGSDRLASDESIKGAYAAAQNWDGIVAVIPESLRLEGTGTREVPELLSWDLVADICEKETADALLVLETFDSDTDLMKKVAVNQVTAILATGKPVLRAPGKVNMNVASFWRLYDPDTKTVIDQYQHNSHTSFSLVAGLPPAGALPSMAYDAGQAYVNRFLPSFYNVRRELYKKGSGSSKHLFKTGYRRAEVSNWEGAIEVWDQLKEDPKRKAAGRACLNIAVGHEVLGDTDEALKWAQRSYEYYGDKLGREYSKILLRRKRIEEK
jgi:hypothetical protein